MSAATRRQRARALARGLSDVLATRDIQAFLARQRAETHRFCAVCKGRVVRKRDIIECRTCGRWMTVAQYTQQQEAVGAQP